MSSTLCFRVSPKPTDTEWAFKLPVKQIFARRYYDHDGSLGGGMKVLTFSDLPWLDGVLAAANYLERDMSALRAIADRLREGEAIEMWFEV